MNGQEHYRQAEHLIAYARRQAVAYGPTADVIASTLAEAQVHATLAQADALAEIAGNYGTGRGYGVESTS